MSENGKTAWAWIRSVAPLGIFVLGFAVQWGVMTTKLDAIETTLEAVVVKLEKIDALQIKLSYLEGGIDHDHKRRDE